MIHIRRTMVLVLTVFVVFVVNQRNAGAQCGQICSTTSGRATINSSDTTTGNIGVGLSFGGTTKWSIASFQSGGEFNVNYFTLWSEVAQKHAIIVDSNVNEILIGGPLLPNGNNTFPLGATGARWTTVYATNGTINTSDAREKREIDNLKYGLHQVLKLRPVTFKWRTGQDDSTHIGLIAQEVEQIVPEIVKHGKSQNDSLGLNYSELIPVLVSAIQMQQRTIAEQGERLSKLERRTSTDVAPKFSSILGGGFALAALPIGLVVLGYRKRRRSTPN